MQHFTEDEVLKLLPMRACVDQMRLAFEELLAGRPVNQPRRRLILKTGSVLHQMAGSYGNYFATKIYSSNLKHGGLHQMFVILYDAETGFARRICRPAVRRHLQRNQGCRPGLG